MKIQSGTITIDSAQYPVLLDNDPGGNRTVNDYIPFPTAFAGTPTVAVSLNRIDMDKGNNFRILTGTDTVNASGFELVLMTWADSKVYSAGITWIAYGD